MVKVIGKKKRITISVNVSTLTHYEGFTKETISPSIIFFEKIIPFKDAKLPNQIYRLCIDMIKRRLPKEKE